MVEVSDKLPTQSDSRNARPRAHELNQLKARKKAILEKRRKMLARAKGAQKGKIIMKKPKARSMADEKPMPVVAIVRLGEGKEDSKMLGFKFQHPEQNSKLIAALKKAQIKYGVDNDGVIHFLPEDEERVEDMIISLRSEIFDEWRTISCPPKSLPQYRQYMEQHHIPYEEEIIDGNVGFLIPRRYRPHSWDLGDSNLRHSSHGG